MRMIAGQRGPALAGIKSNNGIPECYGLHGIWESGGIPVASSSPSHGEGVLSMETGGIRIYRPLLGFSKARLIATCVAERMGWFEDHTNKNPTLTTRNAIRHIYNTSQLPAALSKGRLLRLAENLVTISIDRNRLKESYLANCEMTRFSTRSGTMIIKFPELAHVDAILAAEILRHVILLITPEEQVPVSSLRGAVRHIFNRVEPGNSQRSSKKFNVAGVLFEPCLDSNEFGYPSPNERDLSLASKWLICRQPYVSSVPKPIISVALGPHVWSEWKLWDGRYWIRFQHHLTIEVVVRPFSSEDVAKFRRSLSSAAESILNKYFKGIAKGEIRYTLPCIVVRKDGEDMVVGLPSLEIYSENSSVECQIRYKKIYWDSLPAVTSHGGLS
jgi:tRNA(Ile)-lysidine synthase